MIQVYKIMHGIDKVDMDKFFTVNRYYTTTWSLIEIVQKKVALIS